MAMPPATWAGLIAAAALVGLMLVGLRLGWRPGSPRRPVQGDACDDRIQDVVELAGCWFWETGPDLRLVRVAAANEPADWLLGHPLPDALAPPESEPERWQKLVETLEARHPLEDFEAHLVLPSGTSRNMLVSGKPVMDAQGRFQGYRGTLRDITVRRQAEDALWHSEMALWKSGQRYQRLIENAADAIFLIEADGRIIEANRRAAEMFGYDAGTLTRMSVGQLDESYAGPAFEKARQRLQTGEALTLESEGRRRDGSRFPIEVRAARSEDGERMRILALVRDVSERKAYEEALIEAKERAEYGDRAKTQFLAAMSHELRTPLNAIIGFADMMAGEMLAPLDESYKAYVEDIRWSGEHLLGLINDILDVSRLETGQITLNEQVFALSPAIDAVLRLIRPRADNADIALDSDLAPDLPAFYGDERRFKQILFNLLSNAIEFTPAGGRAGLEAWLGADGGLFLRVTDTGSGIPEDDRDRIFQPFTQADLSDTRSHQGAGLGLYLVRRFVLLHDGVLELDSTPGAGTTVTVHLPARRLRPAEGAASA